MIIPDSKVKLLRENPNTARALDQFPLAFFGHLIPYPKQAAIIRMWLDVQPKVCIVTGWKRTCKTSLAAWIGSCWLYGQLNENWPACKTMGITKGHVFRGNQKLRTMLIGGKSMDHISTVLMQEYKGLLPKGSVTRWFNRSEHCVKMTNEAQAVIRSYDQDLEAWKSGAYNLIHLDEEPPLEVLNECLDRTRTTSGKIIITVAVDDADVSYLPDAILDPLKYFGTDSFLHFELGVEDVPDDIIPQKEKEIVYRQYDHTPLRESVRKGKFSYLSGKWWPEFTAPVHVIPPFPVPKEWKRWRSIDAGVAAPSACAWAALHPQHNIIFIYREYYKTGTTIAERCKDIIEMSGNKRQRDGDLYVEVECGEKYENTLIDYHVFKRDEVTGDGLDYEYVKNGLTVMPSTTLGQEARRELIRKWLWVDMREKHFITHEYGAPKIYIFSDCTNTIWEAQKKSVKRPSSDRAGVTERRIQNKDDHLLDSLEALGAELGWIIEGREMV